jgi:hypothetical protein
MELERDERANTSVELEGILEQRTVATSKLYSDVGLKGLMKGHKMRRCHVVSKIEKE